MTEYGGFWIRFLARTVDAAVLLPCGVLNVWAWYQSTNIAIVSVLILSLATPLYMVALHAAYGQSLGKMLLGLKVERANSERLSWSRILVRFSPLIVSQVITGVGTAFAIRSLPEGVLVSSSYMQKAQLVFQHYPSWAMRCMNLYSIWVLLDVAVLVASKNKCAIHDFLAGSVVRRSRIRVFTGELQAG